jgi:uncharacterized membrane protein
LITKIFGTLSSAEAFSNVIAFYLFSDEIILNAIIAVLYVCGIIYYFLEKNWLKIKQKNKKTTNDFEQKQKNSKAKDKKTKNKQFDR